MEFRVLNYFLAVAREESISRAAELLHVTQPNLSRQIQNLEEEIGKPLFIRGNRKTTLTEAGLLLFKRAEEIIQLYFKTEAELKSPTADLSGNVYIGGGESYAVKIIAQAAKSVQDEYPLIKFHFFSGDTLDVIEKLDSGLIDFGILIEPVDLSKYDYMNLPLTDTWGVLMRKDSLLSAKASIAPEDLWDVPLLRSKHSMGKSVITDWFHKNQDELNIVATYNLIYNASLLVEEGMGYVVSLDKLINTTGSNLCFRPLAPALETHLYIAWKKYQIFSKSAKIFMQRLQELI